MLVEGYGIPLGWVLAPAIRHGPRCWLPSWQDDRFVPIYARSVLPCAAAATSRGPSPARPGRNVVAPTRIGGPLRKSRRYLVALLVPG